MARKTVIETEKTRNAVLNSAQKLFATSGVTYTTIEMIAEEAGFSRGSVYWHFKNKNNVAEAVCQRGIEQLENYLHDMRYPSICSLEDAFLSFIAYASKNKTLLSFIHIIYNCIEENEENENLIKLRRKVDTMLNSFIESSIISNNPVINCECNELAFMVIHNLLKSLLLSFYNQQDIELVKCERIIKVTIKFFFLIAKNNLSPL